MQIEMRKKVIGSFFVAIATASLFFSIFLVTFKDRELFIFTDLDRYFSPGFVYYYFSTFVFVLIQSVIFAIPVLLILKHFKIKSQLGVIVAAMLVAVVPWFFIAIFPFFQLSELSQYDIKNLIAIAISGGVAGFVFERLVREKNPSRI